MALTKEQLVKLGVPEAICDGVIAASAADTRAAIDGSYVPKEKMDSILEKNKELDKQVADRDSQIAKLGAFQGDNEKLKAEVEKLTTDNAETKKQYEAESVKKDKRLAVHGKLMGDGCVDPAEVADKFDLEQIVLDKAGSLIGGYDNQRQAIEAQKPYYFPKTGAGDQNAQQPPVKKDGDFVPPGWQLAGQTPPADADMDQLTGPEAEAVRMAKQMAASSTAGVDIASRAASHYFGATAAPAAVKNT